MGLRKDNVIHMIKPGRFVTVNKMVETYCRVIYYDKNAAHLIHDVTCKKCRVRNGREKNLPKNKPLNFRNS